MPLIAALGSYNKEKHNMKTKFTVAMSFLAISSISAEAAIVTDGDFSAWTLGAVGTTTTSREVSGGNPDARINITTVSGPQTWGTAIKTDYSTDLALSGSAFELRLDVLSGPGAIDDGQRIYLLVEQGPGIYASNLDITGYPRNWDTLSFTGSFIDSSFFLLSGAGPSTPDFAGGINTKFGFAASNSISGTLTQYYDNYSLSMVPIPPAAWLFGSAMLSMFGYSLKGRREKARSNRFLSGILGIWNLAERSRKQKA